MRVMSDNYTNVLLEEMNSKFDAVLEMVGGMNDKIIDIQSNMATKDALEEVKTIKSAVTDTSHQVQNHERRITKLETV